METRKFCFIKLKWKLVNKTARTGAFGRQGIGVILKEEHLVFTRIPSLDTVNVDVNVQINVFHFKRLLMAKVDAHTKMDIKISVTFQSAVTSVRIAAIECSIVYYS
ncbi:unnamed protein product [Hymenolepis diminuta]|uniref:Uncharacterized protein n=1 Tax=Hymenolepis diminuta TaxID=6216 RepID=A0A0R3SNN3_HYMDI|nr:unnamed protein product [Hymenolepis diminuta]